MRSLNVGVVKSLIPNGNINALTINVYDWFQIAGLQDITNCKDSDKNKDRISITTIKMLNILSKMNVKATFFVPGVVAEKDPEIIKRIHNGGHEIAILGYSNKSISNFTEDEFCREVKSAVEIVEKITGQNIVGYRAPHYSIMPDTVWACEILSKLGLQYDSSIFPVKHDNYGFLSAPRFPFIIDLKKNGKLIEFPLSTIRFLGNNIPIAGGAYLRLLPYWFTRYAIKKLNATGNPAIVYLHPWDLDIDQPHVKLNFALCFKHYGNRLTTEKKLIKLLHDFQFGPIREVLGL